MPKTKEQKRKEAQERATASLQRRSDDLMWWIKRHHTELSLDAWDRGTVRILRSKVSSFYDLLRDCGLPHEVGAFYILHNKVLLAQDTTGSYKQDKRKCLYCRQPFGQYHKAPCAHETSGRVALHEALFIDERK